VGDTVYMGVQILLDHLGIVLHYDPDAWNQVHDRGVKLYQKELGRLSACSRGLVSISDIDLTDDVGDHVLHFHCNGRPRVWKIPHGPNEDYDAFDVYINRIHELVPDQSPERWCWAEAWHPDEGPTFVFGDPHALEQLGVEVGAEYLEYVP
jgi:hypothetical protein